ncbi:MAG: 50S ribosomal protein L17 [Solirubrobacterales bacterium]
MSYRRLGFRADHRRALLRNAVTSLLIHEKIATTEMRAKEIQRIADKMITLAKKGDLHARRQALSFLFDIKREPAHQTKQLDADRFVNDGIVDKLFTELAPRYGDRSGGYTRIIKTGFRKGDGASMCVIELVK